MTKANCPSCGAEVLFKSAISVFSVCGHCRSMVVRHDMDVESLGEMAQLPDDVSPIKIGTRGKYKNNPFEVVGRLKVAWSEGYWNEWFVLFENGEEGWLAEAMGFFMMSSEVKAPERIPRRKDLKVGNAYELAPSRPFYVDDIKEATCIGSEGELPFKGLVNRKTLSVDMSSFSCDFVNIEYADGEEAHLYIGRYVEFEELALTNLRDLAADIKKIRSASVFKCPSCGGPFSILTPGVTASVACKYCGSTIDATNRTLSLLSKSERNLKIRPLIELGSKGRLFGAEWEVIGFMRRSDKLSIYMWDEYLLFNPYKGFRWLTTYNGHWNFVEMMRTRPARDVSGSEIKFRDKVFKRFLIGQGRVYFVLGEFYWRVKLGDMVDMTDYICPPEILSCESDGSEAVWSLGRYIEPKEISEAFATTEELPAKTGVAPNQPSPYTGLPRITTFALAGFFCLLTMLQIYFVMSAPDKEVFRGDFTFNRSETSKSVVTRSFDIPGGVNNLSVTLTAPLQNDWLETGIDLVDEKTGRTLGFEQSVEYYSGSDSDGSWSEGSRDTNLVLASVPEGRYHLVIQPAADTQRSGETAFSLSLRRGVAGWCNYVLALLLLAIYPAFICWRNNTFEMRRWSESDVSPAGGAGAEEEEE